MKICSFLPAATRMIYQMGFEEHLCGVTFECHSDKPKVIRSHLEGNTYSSAEIEKLVSESSKSGRSLYYVDEELLQKIEPDVIFTQDVCEVCQISTSMVQRAIFRLKKKPLIVPLTPRNLSDVYNNAITIAGTLGREEAAYRLLADIEKCTNAIIDNLRRNKAPLKRVLLMEWLDPIYNCGHWIPYQIAQAGGVDMLSNPAGYSVIMPWEKVIRYNPEIIVLAPCGFDINRTAGEIEKLTTLEGWKSIEAVKNNAVFIADSQLFTCPDATSLATGIELLAHFFHPDIFPMQAKFEGKYLPCHKAGKVLTVAHQ